MIMNELCFAVIPLLAITSGVITKAVVGLVILAIFWIGAEKAGVTGTMGTLIRAAIIIGGVAILIWLLLALTGTSLP